MNYYIQGDAANADKIKAAFENKGYDTTGWKFNVEGGFYYGYDGRIDIAFSKFLINLIKTHHDYQELPLPVEPKFKVGDDIKTGNTIETIAEVGHATRSYYCESGRTISFENQDLWHLAPKPHYDIARFQPFDKVLVRDEKSEKWVANLYSHYRSGENYHPYNFVTIGTDDVWIQCIPFNDDTKHLLGTTDMPDECYINW